MRDKAWAILRGDIKGDQGWARKVLYDSAYYKDPQGKTQYSDNTNMVSGRAVQVYTDMLLVEDADVTKPTVKQSTCYTDTSHLTGMTTM